MVNNLIVSIIIIFLVIIGIIITFKKIFSFLKNYNENNEIKIQKIFQDNEFRLQKEIQDLKNYYEKKIDTSLLNANTQLINTNRLRLKEILDPFKDDLHELKKRNEVIHESQTKQVSALRGTLSNMLETQSKLANEANNLANSLRGQVKLQGMWGEGILKQLLESSGLKKGIHYEEQTTYKTEDEKIKRPDFIINLPENKKLIIDVKLSLNSYVEYYNATNETDKKVYLEAIGKNLKNHINNLASKEYHSLEGMNSIDGVFLFISLEALLFIIINNFNDLFLEASKKNIYITSSTLLLPLLQVIGSIWKAHNQNKNTLVMANIAGKIYDKCSGILSDFDTMQEYINKADRQLNNIKTKLTGKDNLVRNAERLMNLGANTSKQMPKSWQNIINEAEEVVIPTEVQMKETSLFENKITDKGV